MCKFFDVDDKSRIIQMAWQDRTPFESIKYNYGLTQNEVQKLMRLWMKPSSFKMWRKRVKNRNTKHLKKLSFKPIRFKGPW
ncbi:MAG TPA: TIGR03643 family protein [Sulfurospirillum sp. UBA12182]|jgi:uncharacterized protein (TIGR03643 family)|nr:MAG TPA: TIGR03643 family protein [Sulfurospirillum sp. UBA12182]